MPELADHIMNKLNETVAETTVSANVAYLPGGFSKVSSALKTLARAKTKWKIEVLEDADEFNVQFEQDLGIKIPRQHWQSFSNDFGEILQTGVLSLESQLKEAEEDNQEKLLVELKSNFLKLLSRDPIKTIDQQISKWVSLFPKSTSQASTGSAISAKSSRKDIELLVGKLSRVYKDDTGYLELLTTALKNKEPLNAFEELKKYDYLYATKIKSVYEGVHMKLQGDINLSFDLNMSIYIENQQVLDELGDAKSVKVVGKQVLPVGNRFPKRFFKYLKDTIIDIEEKAETEKAEAEKKEKEESEKL